MTLTSFSGVADDSSSPAPGSSAEAEDALSPEEFFDGDPADASGDGGDDSASPSPAESPSETATIDADGEEDSDDADSSGSEAGDDDTQDATGTGSARTDAVVDLVNDERAEHGCEPLRVDSALTAAAQAHSADMAAREYMSHTSPDGVEPVDRALEHGYEEFAAENVAAGQGSAQAVVNSWMNSDGHRENILNCDYVAIGVGEQDRYWTQKFGRE